MPKKPTTSSTVTMCAVRSFQRARCSSVVSSATAVASQVRLGASTTSLLTLSDRGASIALLFLLRRRLPGRLPPGGRDGLADAEERLRLEPLGHGDRDADLHELTAAGVASEGAARRRIGVLRERHRATCH